MSDENGPEEEAPVPEPQPEPDLTDIPIVPPVDLEDDKTIVSSMVCEGTKANGEPCKAMKIPGTNFCQWHQPGGSKPAWTKKADVPEATKESQHPILTQPYPFQDGSVSENAAIRMIAMVKPNCPNESNPEISRRDGTSIPNPRYTGEPNCQQVYKLNDHGRWDVAKCIELGHDPYYTVFRKTIIEETVGPDGYVSETRQRVIREKRINIVHVSDNQRHTNRTEIPLALLRGLLFLGPMNGEDGFICTCSKHEDPHRHEPPCEFRNCTRPQTVKTRYGTYCSGRHARLVGADERQMLLPVGGDPHSADRATMEREQMLDTINIEPLGG